MSEKEYTLLFDDKEIKNLLLFDINVINDRIIFNTHSKFREKVHDCLNLEKTDIFQKEEKIDFFFYYKKRLEEMIFKLDKITISVRNSQNNINKLILLVEDSIKKVKNEMLKKQIEKWGIRADLEDSIFNKVLPPIETKIYEDKNDYSTSSSVQMLFLFSDEEEKNKIKLLTMKPMSLSLWREKVIDAIKKNEEVLNNTKKYDNIEEYLDVLLKRYNSTKNILYHLKNELLRDSKELERIYKLNHKKAIEWNDYFEKMKKIVESKKLEKEIEVREKEIEKKKNSK